MKVKYADFRQITRSRSQPGPVSSRESLGKLASDLVRSVLPPVKGIRLVGVTVSNFVEKPETDALPIFSEEVTA